MSLETKVLSTINEEFDRGLTVISSSNTWLIKRKRKTVDYFYSCVSNVLVGNPLLSPVFKVKGSLGVVIHVPSLVAVVGDAEVRVNERSCGTWRAIPVRAGWHVHVTARNGSAYMAVYGLEGRPSRVVNGALFSMKPLYNIDADISARYVPPSLVAECATSKDNVGTHLLSRILQHIKLACEMARSGARLVRVKVGGLVYDVWVKEVE
ncbi:MAG: hypothetical protein NZ954_07305 [Thermofilaceae archaeon]|nr:hypothetical protein [Thermofilaceae archaeon]MCX8180595.1 hypothetical protein [Thermofilaceae archaeon]MDW8003697.1 hypothetical protein [Thermofilaceae archaeon]